MLETVLHFFIFYAGILALMMSLGQLVERQRNAGNYIMSAFLCCVGVYQLYHGAMLSGLLLEYPHLGLLHVPFLYFAGPLLYFYFKQLGKLDFRFRKVYLLHFVPGLLLILALLPFYAKSAGEKRQFLQCCPALGSRMSMLNEYTGIILFIMISITVYLILFLKESTYLWNRKYLRLKRIGYLSHLIIITTCAIIFVYFAGLLLSNIFSFSRGAYLTLITVISVATCILVLLIYLMGKRYPEYFREFQREVERIRYEISRIEGHNVEAVLRHLNRLMEEEKIFCDEDMTLHRLAEAGPPLPRGNSHPEHRPCGRLRDKRKGPLPGQPPALACRLRHRAVADHHLRRGNCNHPPHLRSEADPGGNSEGAGDLHRADTGALQYGVATAGLQGYDLSSLRLVIYGGQAVSREFLLRMKEMAPNIGTGDGLTETSGFCTYTNINATVDEIAEGIGYDMPLCPISIREKMNPDGTAGREKPAGEIGDICFSGPQLFLGYLNDPENTAKTISRDGFCYTGDLGSYDEKGLHFAGRSKLVIKPKGYQVFPEDIEKHISTKLKDTVNMVGVVGAEHEIFSEGIMAFVEAKEGANVTPEEVMAACEDISSYSRPSHVEILKSGELPLNRVAKTDYMVLKERAKELIPELRAAGKWDQG